MAQLIALPPDLGGSGHGQGDALLADCGGLVADQEAIAAAGFTTETARHRLGRLLRAVAFEPHIHALIVSLGLTG
jgi:hypothetical protein